jgi:hypothetical protein
MSRAIFDHLRINRCENFHSFFFNCFLICKKCDNKISDPRLLPCGISLCSTCTQTNERTLCSNCGQMHEMPDDGFPKNQDLQEFLDIEVNDFSSTLTEFYRCFFGLFFYLLFRVDQIRTNITYVFGCLMITLFTMMLVPVTFFKVMLICISSFFLSFFFSYQMFKRKIKLNQIKQMRGRILKLYEVEILMIMEYIHGFFFILTSLIFLYTVTQDYIFGNFYLFLVLTMARRTA